MTHKERLLTAVNHEEPDRVPICAFYTPEVERKLLRHLGAGTEETSCYQAVGGPLPILHGARFPADLDGTMHKFLCGPGPGVHG